MTARNGVLGALATLAGALGTAAVLAAAVLLAAPTADAQSSGVRWRSATTVCFTTNTISDTAWLAPFKQAVREWDAAVDLRVIYRTDCKAGGYKQVVTVFARNYGSTGWWGEFRPGYMSWERTNGLATDPWTKNGWNYVYTWNQSLRLNSKPGTSKHVALHEIGHALGLAHPSYTKSAVMANGSTAKGLTFWDVQGWVGSNKPGVNVIYRNG